MREAIYNFLLANGYGLYIWPCYLLFFVCIAWQVMAAIKKGTALRKYLTYELQAGTISDKQA